MLPTPNSDFIALTGLPQGFVMPQVGAGDIQTPLAGASGGGNLQSLLQTLQQQQLSQAQALPGITSQGASIPGLPGIDPGSLGSGGSGQSGPAVGQGVAQGMPSLNMSLASLGPQGAQFGAQAGPGFNLGVGPTGIGIQGNTGLGPGANSAFNSLMGMGARGLGFASGVPWGGLLSAMGAPAMMGALAGPIGGLLGLMSTINSISQGIPGTFANSFQGIEGARGWATQEEINQALAALQGQISTVGGPQSAIGPGNLGGLGPSGAGFMAGGGPTFSAPALSLADMFSGGLFSSPREAEAPGIPASGPSATAPPSEPSTEGTGIAGQAAADAAAAAAAADASSSSGDASDAE